MNYELTVVLPDVSEAKQSAALEKVKKLIAEAGGSVEKVDKWGKRQLAYPIRKNKEGVYYLLALNLDPEKTNPVNRVLENDEQIIRHLIVRTEQKVAKVEVETKKEKGKKKKAK